MSKLNWKLRTLSLWQHFSDAVLKQKSNQRADKSRIYQKTKTKNYSVHNNFQAEIVQPSFSVFLLKKLPIAIKYKKILCNIPTDEHQHDLNLGMLPISWKFSPHHVSYYFIFWQQTPSKSWSLRTWSNFQEVIYFKGNNKQKEKTTCRLRETSANDLTDKGLVCKIYKQLMRLPWLLKQ